MELLGGSEGHYGLVQSCKITSTLCFKGQLDAPLLCNLLSSRSHLVFPLPAGPLVILGNKCRLFSPVVLPRSDEACTCGQLVVASRESQYKIFHFHHGGLDKLSEVFQQWKYCTETHLKDQVPERGSWGKEGFSSRCFTLRFLGRGACWRIEAMSSCHRVRRKATMSGMLFRMQLRVGREVSVVLAYPHPFLFCLWNMGEDNPEDLLRWLFC